MSLRTHQLTHMNYLDQEIEECIECLERSARETGNTHNEMMRVRNPAFNAPNAYQATNSWHAAEISRLSTCHV